MPPSVFLFDIDGTLIDAGGAGRRALEQAFECHAGRRDACRNISFDGMTDRAIVRAALTAIGEEPHDGLIDEVMKIYLEVLPDEARGARIRVLDGIEQALGAVRSDPHSALGLGTGNVREGARVKLSRVGLFDWFTFGGFGCDSEDRAELLRIGAERGARELGLPVAECRVVVVGDTPRDVAATKAIGAVSIGVASGSYTEAELLACGAAHAFATLAAPGAMQALFPSQQSTKTWA